MSDSLGSPTQLSGGPQLALTPEVRPLPPSQEASGLTVAPSRQPGA